MTLRVVESQKFDADNKPILYKGKPTYMSSSTLLDLYQMTSLVVSSLLAYSSASLILYKLDLVSFPAMSRAERIHGSEQLRKASLPNRRESPCGQELIVAARRGAGAQVWPTQSDATKDGVAPCRYPRVDRHHIRICR